MLNPNLWHTKKAGNVGGAKHNHVNIIPSVVAAFAYNSLRFGKIQYPIENYSSYPIVQ